jgi:two-component system response regulator HupR/HoxA
VESNGVKVLAVDDNAEGLFALEQLLRSKGYDVVTASSGGETLAKAESERPDVILLDVMMPAPNGYEVTKILKAHPDLRYIPVVLLTGRDDLKDIVFGLEQGADGYVCKPYESAELIARLHAALRTRSLYAELHRSKIENRRLQNQVAGDLSFGTIIGKSAAMQSLYHIMSKVVESDVPVLITGDSGTGKEVVANALHANGPRRDKSFVVQNCSAFNENLLESELFGHVKGAFTGAVRDKQGLFEVADGGTFFLDELGEMSPALQVKLLRVLQDGTFMPVGGTKQKKVDVRIIAATNRDLEGMVKKGTFREDLYYRLNVVNLQLPRLCDREGDIPRLVEFFLAKMASKSGRPKRSIAREAMLALERYSWPGNIRQLENELQRAEVMSGKADVITLDCLSPHVVSGAVVWPAGSTASEVSIAAEHVSAAPAGHPVGGTDASGEGKLKDAIEALERELITAALARCDGNKSEAARQLGISRSNLIAKAQSFGIE